MMIMRFRRDISDWTPEEKADYDRRAKWVIVGFVAMQAAVVSILQMSGLLSQELAYKTVADDERVPAEIRTEYREAAEDSHDSQLPYVIVMVSEAVAASGLLIVSAVKRGRTYAANDTPTEQVDGPAFPPIADTVFDADYES